MVKEQLYRKCLDIINARIDRFKSELDMMKESMEEDSGRGGDEESNGGVGVSTDVYTKTIQYLDEATAMKNMFKHVDIFQSNDTVKVGSVVECSNGNFFLSVPLGKVELDGKVYFAISKEAPVGQLLYGKKEGDSVSFNNNTFTINKIH